MGDIELFDAGLTSASVADTGTIDLSVDGSGILTADLQNPLALEPVGSQIVVGATAPQNPTTGDDAGIVVARAQVAGGYGSPGNVEGGIVVTNWLGGDLGLAHGTDPSIYVFFAGTHATGAVNGLGFSKSEVLALGQLRGAGNSGGGGMSMMQSIVQDQGSVQEHAITSISNATPSVVTLATTPSFYIGERVAVFENSITDNNQIWTVTAQDAAAKTVTLSNTSGPGGVGVGGVLRNVPSMFALDLQMSLTIDSGGFGGSYPGAAARGGRGSSRGSDDTGGITIGVVGVGRATDGIWYYQTQRAGQSALLTMISSGANVENYLWGNGIVGNDNVDGEFGCVINLMNFTLVAGAHAIRLEYDTACGLYSRRSTGAANSFYHLISPGPVGSAVDHVLIGNDGDPTSFGGSIATRKQDLVLGNGANNDIAVTKSVVRITGPTGAFSISSIANPTDGRRVTLLNLSGQAMTITNAAATGTAANRILTSTGANLVGTLGNITAITLIYDSTSARWRETEWRP